MNSDIQQILDQAKELLKDEMSQISHKTWIEPLKIASITDNNIVLVSEDSFKRDMADTKFHDLIMNTFSVILQKNCTVSIVCEDEMPAEKAIPEVQTFSNNNSYSYTNLNPKYIDTNKSISFEVTDENLLELSGGIVQGMSGSPIIQNNKLIGAVTHVVIDEVNKGYAVFIRTMLEEGDE